MHQNLVLDTPGRVGGQLDILVGLEGIDGLDETDGANGNQILNAHAGIFKPPGNIDHQPEIVFDQRLFGRLVSGGQGGDAQLLLLGPEGRRQDVAAADVIDRRGLPQPEGSAKDFARVSYGCTSQ